jgi:hypothetical protein
MTNTASNLRADPFGIDVRDNHSSFDPSSYDVNEQHRQVELLKSSSSNLNKPAQSLMQPKQSTATASLIANAISHQMLKAQGLSQEESDDGSGSPGIFGFSKRLGQLSSGTRSSIEEPPKPVVPNISE